MIGPRSRLHFRISLSLLPDWTQRHGWSYELGQTVETRDDRTSNDAQRIGGWCRRKGGSEQNRRSRPSGRVFSLWTLFEILEARREGISPGVPVCLWEGCLLSGPRGFSLKFRGAARRVFPWLAGMLLGGVFSLNFGGAARRDFPWLAGMLRGGVFSKSDSGVGYRVS